MASINVLGDFNKSGLTMGKIQDTVKAVFDCLASMSSRAKQGEVEGSLHSSFQEIGRNDKSVNIAFVSENEIAKLNKEYRKKDGPTDVLSFDYGDEGDILLCIKIIDKMKDPDEDLGEAVEKTLIHGVLHLFGFDHETAKERAIMKDTEKKIYTKLCHSRGGGNPEWLV